MTIKISKHFTENTTNMDLNDQLSMYFGKVCILLSKTERRSFSIAACYLWLWPAIRLGQIVSIGDSNGNVVAFATWAFISSETQSAYLRSDLPFLNIEQWNEGENLWILDFFAPAGYTLELARLLNSAIPKRCKIVRWRRQQSLRGEYAKIRCGQFVRHPMRRKITILPK